MDLVSPWFFLGVGLLLTLPPVPTLFPGRVKYRSVEYLEITLRNDRWWKMWRKILLMPSHWLELVRAYLGMRCLLGALEVIRARGTYPGFSSAWMVAAMALGVATLALFVMLAAFRNPEGTLAPVAFVTAAVFAVVPLPVGSLALILAVASMISFKSLAAFFVMLALGLAGFGFLFRHGLVAGIFGAGFAALPWVLAFFRQRELVIPLRQSRSKRDATGEGQPI